MTSMELHGTGFLLSFFMVYILTGGLVFMFLEQQQERQVEENMDRLLRDLKGASEEVVDGIIEEVDSVLNQRKHHLLNETNHFDEKWDFFNSCFFAITVVTTIGYGHLAPLSTSGKIFCVIYALFGIPLTGILLGDIGEKFSSCFRDKLRMERRRSKTETSNWVLIKHGFFFFVPWFLVFLIIPALIFHKIEDDWSFIEAFYYCFVTLTTIGFGDKVAGQFNDTTHWCGNYVWLYRIIISLWIIFGLAYLSMTLSYIGQGLRSHNVTHLVKKIRLSLKQEDQITQTKLT